MTNLNSPAALNILLDELEDSFESPIPPEDCLTAFLNWVKTTGRQPYAHQEDALLAVSNDEHVILATPTGSGKSLVAAGAIFLALAQGRTAYYTAPLKALVSEKFFELVELFGANNVGMVTGDVSINDQAPIICCTAEILAIKALRQGHHVYLPALNSANHLLDNLHGHQQDWGVDDHLVVMDEFHFYADPQRGWAWQVPLLELPRSQFLLLSATLGEVDWLAEDLQARTKRQVSLVENAVRPVPLSFSYSTEPLNDLVIECVQTHRAPLYLVHFTQKLAVDTATDLLSVNLVSKEQKAQIAQAIGDFKFLTGFGETLSKLVRHGIGVHHAGMLPRYRRLIEKLAQQGLLPVICGTDTLGVGINVPMKTVIITTLVKYDGQQERHLTAREFHQIAGRAGRAGFDSKGEVIVQAPAHEIENARLLARAANDPAKQKRIVRKKPPSGQLNWSESTFNRLQSSSPERLKSHLQFNHAMVLHLLCRRPDPWPAIWQLASDNHTIKRQNENERNLELRRICKIIHSLRSAGILEHRNAKWQKLHPQVPFLTLTAELPSEFALNAPLSPFALAALDLLDSQNPNYELDVISIIEATLEDPTALLLAFKRAEKTRLINALKLEGVDYHERMQIADEVTHPQPLKDLLQSALDIYAQTQPWVLEHTLAPKSVVRKMIEEGLTFSELISQTGTSRAEGVILRYLSDAYRELRQVIPLEKRSEELQKMIEWLGNLVRSVDSSLLTEWEELQAKTHNPAMIGTRLTDQNLNDSAIELAFGQTSETVSLYTSNLHRLRKDIANALFARVEAAARDDVDTLADWDEPDYTFAEWDADLGKYYDEFEWIGVGAQARSWQYIDIQEDPDNSRIWLCKQVLEDPDDTRAWAIHATVDLDSCDQAAKLVLRVNGIREISNYF